MAVLVQKGCNKGGEIFKVGEDEVLIGRNSRCGIFIDNSTVSRHHAKVLREGEFHKFEDAGSANGTFVNGNMVKATVLRNGDRVQIGKNILIYYEDMIDQTGPLKRKEILKRNVNVLVVDDSQCNQMFIGMILENLGCRCICAFANNGLEALEKLESDIDFNIVLMDCQMPVMDGYTAIGRGYHIKCKLLSVRSQSMLNVYNKDVNGHRNKYKEFS